MCVSVWVCVCVRVHTCVGGGVGVDARNRALATTSKFFSFRPGPPGEPETGLGGVRRGSHRIFHGPNAENRPDYGQRDGASGMTFRRDRLQNTTTHGSGRSVCFSFRPRDDDTGHARLLFPRPSVRSRFHDVKRSGS